MTLRIALFACSISLAAPAIAVNKCLGADGKVAYQDRPCAGAGTTVDAKPNSVGAQLPVAGAFQRMCQGYVADAERAAAGLTAPSAEARARAAADVSAARRRYYAGRCSDPSLQP